MANRRVVFDTNILISGYLWKGSARRAIEKVRQKQWVHLISDETVNELIRVLAYSKFGLTPAEIEPIFNYLGIHGARISVLKPRCGTKPFWSYDHIKIFLLCDG